MESMCPALVGGFFTIEPLGKPLFIFRLRFLFWFWCWGIRVLCIFQMLRQHIKKQRHYFVNKGPSIQGYGFSSPHVWIWELDCEENWALKNWCFWTVMLEKTLHMDITRRSIQKSDWLYSLQPKMEKLDTVSKNKTGSWLWLKSWTPYCQIQT